MTPKEILTACKEINNNINKNLISKAISSLKSIALSENSLNIYEQISKVEDTYKYLCQYMLAGINDTGRSDMICEIKEKLRSIKDQIIRDFLAKDSPKYYYSSLRLNRLREENVMTLLQDYSNLKAELTLSEAYGNDVSDLKKKIEELLDRLFTTLYTSYNNEHDYQALKNYLLSGYADEEIIALSLSALILGILELYDKAKFSLLIDLAISFKSESIVSQSIVGIMLSLHFWNNRIEQDKKIQNKLASLNDLDYYSLIRTTVLAIVGTADTQIVADKLKDEVLPELMKLRPELLKQLREGNPDALTSGMDNNPEWEEILENSGVADKLRQLNEMQGEGADILMMTFSHLKNFPFFNYASNWFLPFDDNHSMLNLDDETKKFLSVIKDSNIDICDSDLYSLALASNQMPESQKKLLASRLSEHLEAVQNDDDNSFNTEKYKRHITKTVRDLYRFFKLFRKKEGMRDPFKEPLNFKDFTAIKNCVTDAFTISLVADYYLKRELYQNAIPLFELLISKSPDSSSEWEKLGYCHQMVGDLINAKLAYEKAALLKQPGPWLTKKLAFVNKKLGNFSEAADYYMKVLEMEPENVSVIINIGNCLLLNDNPGDALQQFYHANYLSPNNPKVIRALAWIELLNGNFIKSRNYYATVINIDGRNSDYLNAGHVEMLLGNFKDALNFYRLSAKDNFEDFEKAYSSDIPILVKLGIEKTTAELMLDMI